MDKFVKRFASSEAALPLSRKTSPLPKTPAKKPVGRPPKRKLDTDDPPPAKRTCVDKEVSTPAQPSQKRRGAYRSHSLQIKKEVADFARLHGVRVAANYFKVSKSTVSDWVRTDFDNELRAPKNGHLPKSGRPLTYEDDVEKKLLTYVLEQHDLQLAVSIDDLCSLAKQTVMTQDFKASRSWATAFMKRNNLTLRAKTTMSQKLPDDHETKMQSFHTFIKKQREDEEFDDRLVINMDETPMYFDLMPGCNVEQTRMKCVLVKTTASDKRHFTIILACSAAGDMLPPMIIFKGKRDMSFPTRKGWVVAVQEKGWVDEDIMIRWVKEILVPFTRKDRTLLVLDSFRAHIIDGVKKVLQRMNIIPAVIPDTSQVQPLDVSINKPFKGELRKSWTMFMHAAVLKSVEMKEHIKQATKHEKMDTDEDSEVTYRFDLNMDLDDLIQSTIEDMCNTDTCTDALDWENELAKLQPSVRLVERRQREINRMFNDCQVQLDNFKENLEEAERDHEKLMDKAEKAFHESSKQPTEVTIEGSSSEGEDDDVQFIQKTYNPNIVVKLQHIKQENDTKPDVKPPVKEESLQAQTREQLAAALSNAGGHTQSMPGIKEMRQNSDKAVSQQIGAGTSSTVKPPPSSAVSGQPSVSELKPVSTTSAADQATLSALQRKAAGQPYPHYSTSIANHEKMEKLYREDVNNIKVGVQVLYKKFQDLWDRGTLLEVVSPNKGVHERKFKVKCDAKKSPKLVNSKHVAFGWSITKPVTVGTRIVALYREDDSEGAFYAGIVAEAPNGRNELRYLVFFDDGYAQYCTSKEIYKVFYQSKPVWEDIHPDTQDFVRDYLAQYPERPMVRLHKGQSVKTEWNGKWWNARVDEVDASLVSMYFSADQRTEWIYRGSTRLEPLYTALSNAEANRNAGKVKRHNLASSGPKKPVVEYTRNNSSDAAPAKPDKKKAVAKKSTTPQSTQEVGKTWEGPWTKKKVDIKPSLTPPTADKYSTTTISNKTDIASVLQERLAPREDTGAVDLESLGTRLDQIVPLKDRSNVNFVSHTCCPKCLKEAGEEPEKLKGKNNPLLIPLFMGWERHVAKMKPSGRRVIFYKAPCGRRLRTLEELDRYLQITDCCLPIDSFCYDTELHVNYEFIPVKTFCDIKDISYGKENVEISCVNGIDRQYPDYVDYSNQRIPASGVKLNLEPEFLVCCDCTDNCRNKSKCACQQLTVDASAIINGGKPNPDAGYKNRRLLEPLISGVYECNSRCACDKRCVNRVVQNGLQNRLQVFKTEKRGWGLRCLDDIPGGGFICIYAGQLLTDQGANEDGQQYGDEYLAELDYMEVVERLKDGYESDVEDIDEDNGNDDLEDDDDESQDDVMGSDSDESFTKQQKHKIKSVEGKSHQTRHAVGRLKQKEEALEKSKSSVSTNYQKSKGSTERKPKQTAQKSTTMPAQNPPSSTASSDVELPDLEESTLSSPNTNADGEPKKKRTGRSTAARYGSMVPTKKDKDGNDSEEVKFQPTRDYFKDNQSCYIMDAKSMGNIGRYLNHSCSPCAFVQNVFVDTHDLRFPWIAFFAGQYISAGTELTWDYNYEVGSVPGKVLYCYCGSAECRGRLL